MDVVSMESNLYLYTTLLPKKTWQKIYNVLCFIFEKNKLGLPSMNEETLEICTEYFIFFCMYPNERFNEEYYQFLKEEEGVKINYNSYIQYMGGAKAGMPIFFQVIGELLKEFEGDMILLENGEFPVFERLKGEAFISPHYDKYQKKLYKKEVLDQMGVPYTEKEELDLL